MEKIDNLICAKWIVPVEPHNQWFEDHAVAIKNGNILDILPTTEAQEKYQAENNHHLNEHVIMPGFVNCHTHAAMTLFRGMSDDLPLMDWLENHIWPAEAQWVSPEFVETGTTLAIAEMIKSGTTCLNDMYFFPDETAQVANNIGMRATVGLIVIDFPTVWASSSDEYIRKGLEVHDRFRSNPLIQTAFAPHAPYTVSDEPLQRIATFAEEMDVPIHMHLHETEFEVSQAKEATGKTPIQRLNELGLISQRMMAVHMTTLDEDDLQIVAQSGAHVVHCPESNLKLASGYCPVQTLDEQKVNVCLGTDGAASNNDLDMLGEMRTAALMAKNVANNASALPAADALRMATLNGAKALGLENRIGSLKIGKAADICAIDLNELATQPVYNPISQLVYAACRDQVSDVWVAGTQLLKNKELTTIDSKELIAKARTWARKIQPPTSNKEN